MQTFKAANSIYNVAMQIYGRAITVSLVLILIASCASSESRFWLINGSSEPISHATILVCGQTIEMRQIQVASRVSGAFRVKADSDYDVSVEFQSGRKLHKVIGYITSGVQYNDEITIEDADVKIKNVFHIQ